MSATLKRRAAARRLQKHGRGGDTLLAHINPREAAALKRMGGKGTPNPKTGLLEFDENNPEDADYQNPESEPSSTESGDWGDLVEAASGATGDESVVDLEPTGPVTEETPPEQTEVPNPQHPNPEDLTSRVPYDPTPFGPTPENPRGVTTDDNGPTGFGPVDTAIANPIATALNVVGGALMPLVSIYNLGVGLVNWLAGTNIPSAGELVTGEVRAATDYEATPPAAPQPQPTPPPQPWGASEPTEEQVAYTQTQNQEGSAGGNGLLLYDSIGAGVQRDQENQAGAPPAVDVPVAPPPTSGVAPVQAAPPMNTGLLSATASGFTNRPGLRPGERFDPDYYRTGSWSFDPATSRIRFTPRA